MYKFLRPLLLLGAWCLVPAARGQVTETPVTVAPGRFLVEMDALSLTVDREPGLKYTAVAAATTFVTTGLTDRLDLQLGAEFFLTQKFDAAGFTERQSGIGDVYVRTKWRFYESAEDYTAIALLPYVKIPTNTGGVGNDSVEGGLIVPFSTGLLGGFNLAAMTELALVRNDNDDGYDTRAFASVSLDRQVLKLFGLYAEATAAKSSGGRPWEGLLGGGVTIAVSERTWWDFAIYRGISSAAADWNHVIRFNFGF